MPSSRRRDPEPALRVPSSFDAEFPTARRRATETFLNLGLLAGGVRSAVEGLITDMGISSMAAFNVLSVLAGDPEPLKPSTIAARMMVSRATITGVLDSLESRGLVDRLSHRLDGRARSVTITAEGRALVNQLVPRVHEFERVLMSELTDTELDTLLASVARLQEQLRRVAPHARLAIR